MSQEVKEMYDLFRINLHTHLKKKIDASVYVTIKNDVLFVRVSKLGIYWETRYPNILEKIVDSKDSKELSNEIVKYFRSEIMHTFFY